MAKKAVTPQTKIVDHTIFIPDGLETVEYTKDVLVEGGGEGADGNGEGDTNRLPPPDKITVVSQVIRKKANGQEVVDVTIEVADVPGIIQYDVRATKT